MNTATLPQNYRPTDPTTSMIAADTAAHQRESVQMIVLSIFRQFDFGLTDGELNRYYDRHKGPEGWPDVSYESPRRRRSDLTNAELIKPTADRRNNKNGSTETVWVLA